MITFHQTDSATRLNVSFGPDETNPEILGYAERSDDNIWFARRLDGTKVGQPSDHLTPELVKVLVPNYEMRMIEALNKAIVVNTKRRDDTFARNPESPLLKMQDRLIDGLREQIEHLRASV